jgi:hypothetical protein
MDSDNEGDEEESDSDKSHGERSEHDEECDNVDPGVQQELQVKLLAEEMLSALQDSSLTVEQKVSGLFGAACIFGEMYRILHSKLLGPNSTSLKLFKCRIY